MEDDGIGAVQKLLSRSLEGLGRGVKHRDVEIWANEFEDAVRFQNRVLRFGQPPPQNWHCFGESSLFGADPERSFRAGRKKTGAVCLSRMVFFFGDCPGVVGRGAVARLAIE